MAMTKVSKRADSAGLVTIIQPATMYKMPVSKSRKKPAQRLCQKAWMTSMTPPMMRSQPKKNTDAMVITNVEPIAIVPSTISTIPRARNHPQ
jgi:hypothetical protein